MASPTPDPTAQSNLGMPTNVAGLLCYAPCCVGLVFSVVAAVVEKQSRFVRFHAFQSLLLHAAMVVVLVGLGGVQIAVGFIAGPLALLVWGLSMLLSVAFLVLFIVMMVKAYGNEEFVLPVIGEMAKGWL